MITIKTSELREFIRRTGGIKTGNVLPILSYWKLCCSGNEGIITKTNLNAHCAHSVDVECQGDYSILLDERMIVALVKSTKSDMLLITLEESRIIISDGRSEMTFSRLDAELFPSFPDSTGAESYEITSEVLYAIKAAVIIPSQEVNNQFSYCYVTKEGDVFSTNCGQVFYRKKFEQVLPTLTLSFEAGSIVTMFENARCSTVGNYDFFDCGKTTYGFAKTEYSPPPFQSILNKCQFEEYFEIEKEDILNFCDLTLKSSPSAFFPIMELSDSGLAGVSFKHEEPDHNFATHLDFFVEKNFTFTSFLFNPKLLIQILKAIDSKYVRFSPLNKTAFTIWTAEDTGLVTLLSALVNK